MYIHADVCMYMCFYIHINVYTQAYIHAYIRTYMHMEFLQGEPASSATPFDGDCSSGCAGTHCLIICVLVETLSIPKSSTLTPSS